MDVPAMTPADDRIERADLTVNAYEVFWDCVDGDDRFGATPTARISADDAYTQFWMESDG